MPSLHPELQDIFQLPRILGSFPFDERFRLSMKLMVYSFLFRMAVTLGIVNAFLHPSILYGNLEVDSMIGPAQRALGLISVLGDNFFTVVWWIRKRDTVSFLMENLDQLLRRGKANVKQQMRISYWLLLFTAATHMFIHFINSYKVQSMQNIPNEFVFFLSTSSTVSFVGQFWDTLHLLRFMFLESTQLYDESSVVNYEKFSTLSEMINEIYEPQILFTITEYFLQIVFYLYVLILPLNAGMTASNLFTSLQLAYCVISIVSIISACNDYSNAERNFNQELRKRMVEEKSRILLRNEKLNFHFVVAQETVFTACGFFTIDRSLICSMISAGTTYLVIVLQYGENPKEISEVRAVTSSAIDLETSTLFN